MYQSGLTTFRTNGAAASSLGEEVDFPRTKEGLARFQVAYVAGSVPLSINFVLQLQERPSCMLTIDSLFMRSADIEVTRNIASLYCQLRDFIAGELRDEERVKNLLGQVVRYSMFNTLVFLGYYFSEDINWRELLVIAESLNDVRICFYIQSKIDRVNVSDDSTTNDVTSETDEADESEVLKLPEVRRLFSGSVSGAASSGSKVVGRRLRTRRAAESARTPGGRVERRGAAHKAASGRAPGPARPLVDVPREIQRHVHFAQGVEIPAMMRLLDTLDAFKAMLLEKLPGRREEIETFFDVDFRHYSWRGQRMEMLSRVKIEFKNQFGKHIQKLISSSMHNFIRSERNLYPWHSDNTIIRWMKFIAENLKYNDSCKENFAEVLLYVYCCWFSRNMNPRSTKISDA